MMKQKRIRQIVLSALFCALVFSMTWIMVPLPTGNVNLGDGALLLCAWLLGGPWAAASAALGATLCDLASGFAAYAPGTFLIKALMVFTVLLIQKGGSKLRLAPRLQRILSAVGAELVMILGYFVYEATFLSYGLAAAASIPFNAIQGGFAILVSCLVYELLSHAGFSPNQKQ